MKTEKQRAGIGSGIIVLLVITAFLPLCLLLFVGTVLYTPIDYIKFKRSAYQKDFPRKYTWLCGRHTDNAVYTVIKENKLPVTYLKFNGDYALSGDFVYGNTVLNFSQPFFYDGKKEAWLFWPHSENGNEAEDEEDAEDDESTDDCLTEEESREYILNQFRARNPDISIAKAVYFYEYEFVKKVYGEAALEKMQQNAAFVIYRKRTLAEAIQGFIRQNL